jgi:hypothetical protein
MHFFRIGFFCYAFQHRPSDESLERFLSRSLTVICNSSVRVETEPKPSKKRGRSWPICGESSGVAEAFRVVESGRLTGYSDMHD